MGAAGAIAQGAGVALQAGQAINSGVKGARASRQLGDAQRQQDQMYMDLLGQGQDLLGGVTDRLAQGPQNNVTIPNPGEQMEFTAPGMNQYDFGQVGQVADQAVANALAAGDRARAGAREGVAQQTAQFQAGLDTALADRGLSRNSGAAAAALQGNAIAAGQQMAGLERDLANQAQAAGLQGAQFDAQNALAMGQMGSQYNLGMNQLGQQSALNQFNANLAAQQQNYGQQMGNAQLQATIDQAANQYNLGAAGQLGGLVQGLFGAAIPGMEAGLDRRAQGVQQAGAGKGAAIGGASANAMKMGENMGGKQTPMVGMSNAQMGSWMPALWGGSTSGPNNPY